VPRYFQRMDGAVNEQEFLDLSNPIIHVSGNLGEDSLRTVDYKPLSGSYLEMRQSVINELRETSGNTETSVGISASGVTAASAIAALQEASGKGSRDATRASYRAYGRIVELCIELIRQFYELPRQFRITGRMGQEEFIAYSNQGLQEQDQGKLYDVSLGMRRPVFDIRVCPQKQAGYSRLSQNELALQLYQLGFFEKQKGEQALMCMGMMDFEGRDQLMQQLQAGSGGSNELELYQNYALAMTEKYEPQNAAGLMASINSNRGKAPAAARPAHPDRAQQARFETQEIARPGGKRA